MYFETEAFILKGYGDFGGGRSPAVYTAHRVKASGGEKLPLYTARRQPSPAAGKSAGVYLKGGTRCNHYVIILPFVIQMFNIISVSAVPSAHQSAAVLLLHSPSAYLIL